MAGERGWGQPTGLGEPGENSNPGLARADFRFIQKRLLQGGGLSLDTHIVTQTWERTLKPPPVENVPGSRIYLWGAGGKARRERELRSPAGPVWGRSRRSSRPRAAAPGGHHSPPPS